MKKIVVTGGTGFLGSAIVDELLARNCDVVILDRSESKKSGDYVKYVQGSILDRQSLVDVFDGAEGVYHLAGSLGTAELNSAVAQAVEVNIIGSLNVFEAAIQTGVDYVFFPSKPDVWLNAYTITKHAVDDFSRLYNKEKTIKIEKMTIVTDQLDLRI